MRAPFPTVEFLSAVDDLQIDAESTVQREQRPVRWFFAATIEHTPVRHRLVSLQQNAADRASPEWSVAGESSPSQPCSACRLDGRWVSAKVSTFYTHLDRQPDGVHIHAHGGPRIMNASAQVTTRPQSHRFRAAARFPSVAQTLREIWDGWERHR